MRMLVTRRRGGPRRHHRLGARVPMPRFAPAGDLVLTFWKVQRVRSCQEIASRLAVRDRTGVGARS